MDITPIIKLEYILFFAIILISIVLYSAYIQRKILNKKDTIIITGLRILPIILFSAILIRPFYFLKKVQENAFKNILLADCSESMNNKNKDGSTRLEIIQDIINKAKNKELLSSKLQLESYSFSNEKIPIQQGPIHILPGKSAIGKILEETIVADQYSPIASIILATDGNSNIGPNFIQVAKQCKEKAIPINCIGIGENIVSEDIAIYATDKTLSAIKNKTFDFSVKISNSFHKEQKFSMSVLDNEKLILKKNIAINANTSKNIPINLTPTKDGLQSYRIKLDTPEEDCIPENDIAYVQVNVKKPDTFNILYLGASLNWNYKFLKLYTHKKKPLKLSSIIKMSKDNFYISENLRKLYDKNAFPQKIDFYNKFDIIILDLRVEEHLTKEQISNIYSFTENRGGGLLCFGPVQEKLKDKNFKSLLPFKNIISENNFVKKHLEFTPSKVYPIKSTESLRSQPLLYLPENKAFFNITELKLGSKNILSDSSNNSILAIQQYGAGRIAYFASESSWQWHLGSDFNLQRYELFWNKLFVWLASNSKERIKSLFQSTKFAKGENSDFKIKVYDKYYKSANYANVELEITNPNNKVQKFVLSNENNGIFSTNFTPRLSGEYKSRIKVKFNDGTRLEKSAFFISSSQSEEVVNSDFKENILQDVARITGGVYINYQNLKYPLKLNLSKKIPFELNKIFFLENWFTLIFLLAILGFEWFHRRKIGLS